MRLQEYKIKIDWDLRRKLQGRQCAVILGGCYSSTSRNACRHAFRHKKPHKDFVRVKGEYTGARFVLKT
jgi:hypothetical protein